jgi:Family of unknown function (DUF5906)
MIESPTDAPKEKAAGRVLTTQAAQDSLQPDFTAIDRAGEGSGAASAYPIVTFTVGKAYGGSSQSKRFDLVNGEVKTTHPKFASRGTAVAVRCALNEIPEYFKDPNSFMVLGVARDVEVGQEYPFKAKDADGPGIPRTEENYTWPTDTASLLAIDGDLKEANIYPPMDDWFAMRQKFVASKVILLVEAALKKVGATLAGVALVVRRSSSANIRNDEEDLVKDSKGVHTFLALRGKAPKEVLAYLHKQLVIDGHGHCYVTKSGALLIRTVIDQEVGETNRIMFEAPPALGEGLHRNGGAPACGGGGELDLTGIDLTVDEAAYLAKCRELKEQPEAKVRAKERKAEYQVRMEQKGIAKGMNPEQARAYAQRLATGGENVDFYPKDGVVFRFDNEGDVTITELLADPGKYHGCSLADPGDPDDQPCKAKFFWNQKEGPEGKESFVIHLIKSGNKIFLHAEDVAEQYLSDEAKAKRREQQKERARHIGEEGWGSSDEYATAEIITVQDALDHFGFVSHGSQVIDLRSPKRLHGFADWANTYCASTITAEEDKKPKPISAEWKRHLDRKTADNVTFFPGGGLVCNDPKGVRCFNVWRDIQRADGDIALAAPFVDHVRHLWGEDADRFLDWLAHIEQKPGVLPHTSWLHIADFTGTGRNWLSSVLARVWAGYVASNLTVEDVLGNFNDRLEAKLLAQVDEIREGGKSVWEHNEKFKSAMNPEYRTINPKYGRKRVEHNVCRFLLFSNSILAIPLDESDRRVEVVLHRGAPLDAGYYTKLYGLLNNRAFINAVGLWLRERDINQFNPGARARMSSAKELLVQANKSETVHRLEAIIKYWPTPWMSQAQLKALVLDEDARDRSHANHMLIALRERGAVKVTTTRQRFPDGVLSEVWQIRAPTGDDVGKEQPEIINAVRATYTNEFHGHENRWHQLLDEAVAKAEAKIL